MKNKGSLLISTGLLLIAAALLLTVYNLYDAHRAAQSVQEINEQLSFAPPEITVVPNYILNPEMEMPTEVIDGYSYIGVLQIPSCNLELPVLSTWSYPNLKIAPCRYKGSSYTNNLIIAAHNYHSHFGRLKDLLPGDSILFIDMDSNIFTYEVVETETLAPTAIAEMASGDWDLTLFTCTVGGSYRVTVRCARSIGG